MTIPVARAAAASPRRLRRAACRRRCICSPRSLRFALSSRARPVGGRARASAALAPARPRRPGARRQTFGAWLREHGQSQAAVDALWDLIVPPHAQPARAPRPRWRWPPRCSRPACSTSRRRRHRLRARPAAAAARRRGAEALAARRRRRPRSDARRARSQRRDARLVARLERRGRRRGRGRPRGPARRRGGRSARRRRRRTRTSSEALGASPIVNLHVVYDRRSPTCRSRPASARRSSGSSTAPRVRLRRAASTWPSRCRAPTSTSARRSTSCATQFVPALEQLLPGGRAAPRRADFFVTREQRATFRPGPGTAALRPATRTALAASISPARGPTRLAGDHGGRGAQRRGGRTRGRCAARTSRSSRWPRDGDAPPTTLTRARELVWPALRAAVATLEPRSARGRRLPLRLDRRRTARRRRRQGGASGAGARWRPAAGAPPERRSPGPSPWSWCTTSPAARRHHGRRPGAPPPRDGLDGVRRGARDPGRRRAGWTWPARCCCGAGTPEALRATRAARRRDRTELIARAVTRTWPFEGTRGRDASRRCLEMATRQDRRAARLRRAIGAVLAGGAARRSSRAGRRTASQLGLAFQPSTTCSASGATRR